MQPDHLPTSHLHTRNIELKLIPEFFDATGNLDKPAETAIGYLSHWAIAGGRFPTVRILGNEDGHLTAIYLKADGTLGYEIFGMRTDETYSFHS